MPLSATLQQNGINGFLYKVAYIGCNLLRGNMCHELGTKHPLCKEGFMC